MADDYDPSEYGRLVAEDYDTLYGAIPDTDDAVACLAELAGDGPVLELGVGTGRLALPLARRGLDVHGIDASEQMIALLREKPGGSDVPATVGNFADTKVAGSFSLVLLALNTIFALPSQEAQVDCFANAATHLTEDGVFVVETFVLDPGRFRNGKAVEPRFFGERGVELQVVSHDPVSQRLETKNVHLSEEGIRLFGIVNQYASPRELDLMARLAGLNLRERWGGWRGQPFTAASDKHVSVYERAP